MAKRIYLAGPFFSETQIKKAERLEKVLEEHDQVGHVFSPRKHQHAEYELFSEPWRHAAYGSDVEAIDSCDVMVALADFDRADTDSGTAWEIGYAKAKGIPVVVIKEEADITLNLMIAMSLTAYFDKIEDVASYDLEALPAKPYDGEVI